MNKFSLNFKYCIGIISLIMLVFSQVVSADRGRAKIVNNTLVADNGTLLRGDTPRVTDNSRNDPSWWAKLRDHYHMNCVRILAHQEPQFWHYGDRSGCGYGCNLSSAQDLVPHFNEWVDRGGEQGFYVIIDYHPVLGHDPDYAKDFWIVIAPLYKNRTHVIYEACNEPCIGIGGSSATSSGGQSSNNEFQLMIYKHIRSMAPDMPLIGWSINYGASLWGDNPNYFANSAYDYSNYAIGFHVYATNPSEVNALKQKYPIIETEIGECWDKPCFDERVGWHEQYGISWITLDGIGQHGAGNDVTVTWDADPYFTDGPTAVSAGAVIGAGKAAPAYTYQDAKLHIRSTGLIQVSMYDMRGALVKNFAAIGHTVCEMNDLSNGAYFLRLRGNQLDLRGSITVAGK